MPDSWSYLAVVEPVAHELHEARHNVMRFGADDEHPLLDAGTAVGFLLGLNYACTYQKAALRLNRNLFGDDRVAAKEAVDLLAQALAERVLWVDPPIGRAWTERMEEVSKRDEGRPTTDTPFWPAPPPPPPDYLHGEEWGGV